uniref:Uncharacterized protein n=1 Tax=Medicago truncatula TaxID=3880 RepID=I3S592_MEDTR|nr:unknown [Medicago truncatula]
MGNFSTRMDSWHTCYDHIFIHFHLHLQSYS